MKLQSKKMAVLLVFLTLWGCNQDNKPPGGIISMDKMAPILAELQIAEANVSRMNLQNYDSSKVAFIYLQQQILKENGVDSALYRKSYEAYARYPSYLDKIYMEAIKIMEARRDTLRNSQKNVITPTDENPPS